MAIIFTAGIDLLQDELNDIPLHQRYFLGQTCEEAAKFSISQVLQNRQVFSVLLIRARANDWGLWRNFILSFRQTYPSTFIICSQASAADCQNDAVLRMALAGAGASMISHDLNAISKAVSQVFSQTRGTHACVYCSLSLDEDSLWHHNPLYHVNEKNTSVLACPICSRECNPRHEPYTVHLRNAHGPCARGDVTSEYDLPDERIYAFSLIVCTRVIEGRTQMLLVQEFASSGFWLPGGRVDPGETLQHAATRECKEEAGCDVELSGVLQFQYSPSKRGSVRMRVVFFAKLLNDQQTPKTLPDYESFGATWVDIDMIPSLHEQRLLRGTEPLTWARYLQGGGPVYPLSILAPEN